MHCRCRVVAKQSARVCGKVLVVHVRAAGAGVVSGGDGGQLEQGFPFRRLADCTLECGCAVARVVAPGELRERHVVMHVFQRRGCGQDHIRMARGLVQVDVQAEHEVQPVERLGQARAVGRREHRVGGHGNQRLDLPLARRLYFLRQAGDGQLPHDFRRAPYTAAVAPGGHATPRAGLARRVGGKRRSLGKHRAARCIHVAGECVDYIHQPSGKAAELLGAGADARIDAGALGCGQGACQFADGRGG